MGDWVEGWLMMKKKTGLLHDKMLAKDIDAAIQLCIEIVADARLTAKQLQIQKEQDIIFK
jgi:hypothetical protein